MLIEVGLEFDSLLGERMLATFRSLPAELRPLYYSNTEDDASRESSLIEDERRFRAFVDKEKYGYFLRSPGLLYNIRIAQNRPIICDCFIDVDFHCAQNFIEHMAEARPVFGFACAPAEREWRNRITVKLGSRTIESWVGRDINHGLHPSAETQESGTALSDRDCGRRYRRPQSRQ